MGTMLTLTTQLRKSIVWLLVIIGLLAGCSNNVTPAGVETLVSEEPTLTQTLSAPTSTPEPAAAVVNGERIPHAWFEKEVDRYLNAQDALGQSDVDLTSAREIVLGDLIDTVLLAQVARDAGPGVTDAEVQARIDALSAEEDLTAWMANWGYTEADLFNSLKIQMLAGIQREEVIDSVPETADQVELRQVFAYTDVGANNALVSLNSGRDFDEVAFTYDPVSGGYLGWVPRGYLLFPAVEDAAFNLQVGAYSEIIESEIGFHIVKVLARENRLLSYDARLRLQRQALHDWLAEKRDSSLIEVLVE